jgi:outer membrane receptor protein involved in Fe transport
MTKFGTRHSGIALGISAAAVATALSWSTPVMAQATSTLRGHVEGAAAGTTVKVTDTVTGQVVTTTVNADGDYVLVGLRPSTYTVEAAGIEAQTITVPVGQTVNYDLGSAGTDIVVTGARAARVEPRTAVISTNVSLEQIENLPQNNRNFLNFAALAPGVQLRAGDVQIQAGAISSDNTNVFIDGLSYKNQVNHGGVAGQNFSQGNPFPQLAVQEFNVATQNFKAEFEQAGSAVIDTVSKTGGTQFHGEAFIEWQPKSFIGRPFFDRPGEANNPTGANKKPPYDRKQYGAALGGPIVKDLLHFFFAFEGTKTRLPSANINLFQSYTGTVTAEDQRLITENNGSSPQSFNQKLYFGKLTLYASPDDTINGSVYIRDEQNLRDFGGDAIPSHGHNISNKVNTYLLQYTHRGDSWVNQFLAAYTTVSNGTPRVSEGPEIILTDGTSFNGTQARIGASDFVQNDNQRSLIFKDTVTLTHGTHTTKFGGKLSFNTLKRLEDLNSNGTYFFDANTYTGFASSTPYGARISTIPVLPATAHDTQIGLFIQDDWQPDDHWTINAGLRWDFESNATNVNFVTPPNIVAALRAYTGWQAAGINPDDYISTGSNRKPFYGAFQPRLGVSYDVHGDRDLVFFAGLGRYYDRSLFIVSGIETIKSYYQSISTLTATPGNPVPKTVDALRAAAIAQGLGGSVWLLNNKTRTPYSDELDFGIRKRFGQIQTALTFSYIKSHNIFQYVRGNRLPDGSYPSFNGIPVVIDNFPAQGQLPGFNGKLNIGQSRGKSTYAAIYLTADKPYTDASGWGFTTAFTFSRPRTNVGTELGSDEFFAGPRVDQFGREYVNGVEKWRFVGTGIVRLPWDIKASSIITLSSGPSFGSVYGFGLPTQVGGQCCIANLGGLQYPKKTFGYANVDVRLAKTFKLPWGHDVTVDFAAFNIFDFVNRTYSSWGAGFRPYDSATGTFGAPSGKENSTVANNARSFQVSAKYKF